MEICLNDCKWEVKGFWPWVPLYGKSNEIGEELMGVTDWLPATVPGGVHYDLYREGLIEHPYRDMQSTKSEWVENRWWVYRTSVAAPRLDAARLELVFKGLDYEADVYVNHAYVGTHEGMFDPAIFDVTDVCKFSTRCEILVILKGVPAEMGQIGRTSLTRTQKSRFNYKWDFSTRLVNIGIWDDVLIRSLGDCAIEDMTVETDAEDGEGVVDIAVSLTRFGSLSNTKPLTLDAVCHDDAGVVAAQEVAFVVQFDAPTVLRLRIHHPELWFPNGYGHQPLYRLRIRLLTGSSCLDERNLRIGIRKLTYLRNNGSGSDALPYTFCVNNRQIYVKGVNLTPLDHLYGNVTQSQYAWLVFQMKRANVNMVRVWGGGVIEKEVFYDLCDQNGILVWQEFIQSSSGVDNVPSKDPRFLKLLESAATAAVKGRRNHPSLAVWSGGNELENEQGLPATYDDENIQLLKSVVSRHDKSRLFLPTSASGPSKGVTRDKGISHDVHGFWKYLGNPLHYDFYSDTDNMFHSEFGVDGLASVKSLRKFLSDEERHPTSVKTSAVWRHHGEWWDTFHRDLAMFGEFCDLESFAACSQWIQAEGLRFILEANQRRKFQNSGSVIWQLNEPWPNVSCTNLVDYYGEGKMAYYWVRKAFAPIHTSIDYRKLNYSVGEVACFPIFITANTYHPVITIEAEVRDCSGNVLVCRSYEVAVPLEAALNAGDLDFTVPDCENDLFFVLLKAVADGNCLDENLYTFSTSAGAIYRPALKMSASRICVESDSDWALLGTDASPFDANTSLEVWTKSYHLLNPSTLVALHVHPVETSNAFWLDSDGAFESIFPGERRTVTVYCVRKDSGGFLRDDGVNVDAVTPVIEFVWFGNDACSVAHLE